MALKRNKKPLTRKTAPTLPVKNRDELIEELLDLLEPDISWNEDTNPRPTQHARECIRVYRQIRPKLKKKE